MIKMYILSIILLLTTSIVSGQPGKCDQTPPLATVPTPSDNEGIFKMTVETKNDDKNKYRPDQTYVLILSSSLSYRPFRWFMITAEDPALDNNTDEFDHHSVDVGYLKTLEGNRLARYSERCYNSVENTDNSAKTRVEVHWVSPKQSHKNQNIRLRAMVAENAEVWYIGENLNIVLEKDIKRPLDSPPYDPIPICKLQVCSEARYEVIFKGRWSRMTHPKEYPNKPDNNGYSYLVGASHSYDFTLWKAGAKASDALKLLAEEANITKLERYIINSMSEDCARTLIRGKRREHPYMSEPSHSLFRVDSRHHLFSVVIAMKPSPDWFLGVSKFELCTDKGWLESSEIPLYPWDAGTLNGISYESQTSVTQPTETVKRVDVGSFDKGSPFYQKNLDALEPFAHLEVKRLNVYPLDEDVCSETAELEEAQEGEPKCDDAP